MHFEDFWTTFGEIVPKVDCPLDFLALNFCNNNFVDLRDASFVTF